MKKFVVFYAPLGAVDTAMRCKRLAVAEVCSEHEVLQQSDAAIAEWFDFVVDNAITLHDDPRLTDNKQPHFTVCERYENTPLCDALYGAFEFAENVASSL